MTTPSPLAMQVLCSEDEAGWRERRICSLLTHHQAVIKTGRAREGTVVPVSAPYDNKMEFLNHVLE